ncbi:MAG: ExeM/NucH family extracellular endonuclease [Caldilineales bacterium]
MANRTTVSGNISSLAIANSNGFWIRWNDLDATSADDGLSVDDFSITPATGETAPSVASTTPANGATAVPATSNLTVTFSEPVDVTGSWFTITCTSSGAHTATVTGGPTTFTLNPDTDFAAGETCTATIVAAQVSDQDTNDPPDTMTADYSWSFGTAAPVGITKIHTIQGSGAGSPLLNSNVTIEGIVVGDFEVNGLKGFFVQEEDADADADVLTSEGIFVFDNNSTSEVALGDKVQVAGKVVEYSDRTVGTGTMTELSNVTITKTGTGSVTPASVTLPETTNGDLERYEGMLVSIVSPMTVAQNYFVGRYGQMTLSASGRLYQPTNQELPGSAAAAAIADLNARSMLILDDGQALARCGDNPNPVPYLGSPPPAVIRAGDSVSNLVGVLDYGQIDSGETDGCNVATALFTGDYRLHPVQAPSFSNVNTRPTAPNAVGGNVQVAAFNVLNYFNTFTGCTAGVGGATTDCRGAANATEFTRQRDKIIAAITTLDADVVGLMEIENDGYASSSAIQDLVNGLNAVAGAGTYAFINPDTTNGTNSLGTDAIRVGLLYKPAVVTPVGSTAVLNSAAFTDPLGTGTPRSRPALAQTFEENTWGERFTAVVNHLKSKGSCPGSGVDLDTGQGCWNATRTAAANYMVNTWLPTNPTGTGDPDVIILGDLNAYAREDPIETIKSAGYTNLINAFMGATAYSYIFDGQSGYLDHALAKNSLTAQVLDATEWHINADEPEVINYSTSFNPPGYYTANAYRASDHDPVLVGLGLYPDQGDLAAGYGSAWHTGQGSAWRLGTAWSGEATSTTGGDDANDDGVSRNYTQSWNDGTGEVSITVTGPAGQWACLNAWLDYSDGSATPTVMESPNGLFDANEHVVNNLALQAGAGQALSWSLEAGVINANALYPMRFRLVADPNNDGSCGDVTLRAPAGGALPTGRADGGEVEDYIFLPGPMAITLASFEAVQQGADVQLTWETTSELHNRGFNLYRGLSSAGWDTQINASLIPSQAQGSSSGFLYTWNDQAGLVAGQTYWYWLEDVDTQGIATLHGPISVVYNVPTAVELSGLHAASHSGNTAAWLLVAWLIILALGAGFWHERHNALR